MAITGGCMCGKIRYTVEGGPLGAGQCYCRDCQYTCGGSPACAFVVTRSSLQVHGTPRVYRSRTARGGEAMRSFCPDCGTPLFGEKSSTPQIVSIMAGSLDDPDLFAPQAVSWAESAPCWAYLDPRLPRFPRDIQAEP
ncbi:MAG: GFA family protein [Candidatus Eremiobacterota bacterium]